jgi:hypothetical protein
MAAASADAAAFHHRRTDMRNFLRQVTFAVAIVAIATGARAENFSTSAVNPTPIPASGVISGNYPASDAETNYYFSIDLKPGDIATQLSFLGRPNRDKSLEFDLKDPKGRLVGYYSVMSGLDANQEGTRVFPADSSGRYLVILKTKGPETTSFKLEIGGSAFPDRQPAPTEAAPFSRSYLAPTPLPRDGVITGTFPGGDKKTTFYYFVADLKAGDLLTQISYAGRPNAPKMLQLELLDAKGRGANSYHYIMGELDANNEKTRAFPVDSSGRYILRVGVSGVEATKFKVELGGSAFMATN